MSCTASPGLIRAPSVSRSGRGCARAVRASGRPDDWLIGAALTKSTKPKDVIDSDALDLLAEQLSTPLQFAEHLTRAFTEAFQVSSRPVTREIVEETLSVGFDDLDSRLARIGYTAKTLAEQFDARPPEINRFMKGRLDAGRTQELTEAMRRAGLPV